MRNKRRDWMMNAGEETEWYTDDVNYIFFNVTVLCVHVVKLKK
jgi:hypothetical protein